MQKCTLFFTLSFLLFLSFSSCERENSLVTQVIELNNDVVIIEEETPILLRHTFNGEEVIDTLGQAVLPDESNTFIHVSNFFYDEYECQSTSTGGFSFSGTGGGTPGGNPQEYSFTLIANVFNGAVNAPIFYYSIPYDGVNVFPYSNREIVCGEQTTDVTVTLTDVTDERVRGTIVGTVVRLFGNEPTCVGATYDTAEVSIEFSLPRQYCN